MTFEVPVSDPPAKVVGIFSNMDCERNCNVDVGTIHLDSRLISTDGRIEIATNSNLGENVTVNIENVVVNLFGVDWTPPVTVLKDATVADGSSLTIFGVKCVEETHFEQQMSRCAK